MEMLDVRTKDVRDPLSSAYIDATVFNGDSPFAFVTPGGTPLYFKTSDVAGVLGLDASTYTVSSWMFDGLGMGLTTRAGLLVFAAIYQVSQLADCPVCVNQRKLTSLLRISRSSVIRWLNKLVVDGYLLAERHQTASPCGGLIYTFNCYRVNQSRVSSVMSPKGLAR